jgi:two-component system, OmpR family, sensor histidine kinase SenX3
MKIALLVIAAAVLSAGAVWVLVRSSVSEQLRAESLRADRAEEDLRQRERSSRDDQAVQDLILSSMEEGVLLMDRDGRTVFANAALARHLGANPSDLEALLPLDLQKAARRTGYSGATTRVVVEVGAPARYLRASCLPLGDDGATLVVVDDVTEARHLDAIRRDFVTNASHELKTPAASIQAAAETLLHVAEENPKEVQRFAIQLDREARRLSRLVADLLDLSRLESGSALDESVRLDVIVREEGERFEEQASAADVTLGIDAPDAPAVRGSARDLSLLVRNLLDNAVTYSRPGGRVTATVDHDERQLVLRVTDTGIGIPSRDLPRVFERFYRVDRARSRETGGTGLGLAIVKHVAENHGGEVRVESELGRGSTFIVQLPRGDVPG